MDITNYILVKTKLEEKITRKHIENFIKKYSTNEETLDVGCGKGFYSNYFPNRLGIDIVKTPAVDIIADAHDLSIFEDEKFSCILCTEVLEHFYAPHKVIDELYRILKVGGTLILTTRFIYPLHNIPGDYYRFTQYGLKHILKKFKIIEFNEEVNTLDTMAVLIQRIAFQTVTLKLSIFKIFWLMLARIFKFFSNKLTAQYGVYSKSNEIRSSKKVQNIMTTGYHIACKKLK